MSKKKELGQFFTTNVSKILQGMSIPPGVSSIVEPFAGNKDLLQWISNNRHMYDITCYDIDPKHADIQRNDSLLQPPSYTGKYVITNPPYLSRNKSADKHLFDRYKCNDLYKCFLISLCDKPPMGGILIIPLNFFSSIRKNDVLLRKRFLSIFSITRLNIFEEQVFDDTTYSVCSLQFTIYNDSIQSIDTFIYPSCTNMQLILCDDNNYTIGGEIYMLPCSSAYTVTRYTRETNTPLAVTHIIVKCIDDREPIQYKYDPSTTYRDDTEKLHCRTYAQLVIDPPISMERQQELVLACNQYLQTMRNRYHSLFLTNYREGNRKRISFDLIYSIVHYHL